MIEARIGKKLPPAFSLDVEFHAGPGVTVLLGPAGAGKSWILAAVAGFGQPDSGRILIDDRLLFDAAARVSAPPRRRKCAYIGPHEALFPHMTVRQNLTFAAKPDPRLERHRRVSETLDRFQLSAVANHRPPELDAGQRLQVALARALVTRPDALLLDHDLVNQTVVQTLRREFSHPILAATRSLETAFGIADQVLLLDSGRIIQRGAPQELLDEPASPEAARLLQFLNVFECTIAALDPGRNSSRLEAEHFAISGPYLPGHFRGDKVWITVHPRRLRVRAANATPVATGIAMELVGVSQHTHFIRLEFSGGIFADVSPEEYGRQKDNKEWLVEFPPDTLRIL